MFIQFNAFIFILFNPYKFIQFNPSKYSFNRGDWAKPWDQKDNGLGKNHYKYNMADEERL